MTNRFSRSWRVARFLCLVCAGAILLGEPSLDPVMAQRSARPGSISIINAERAIDKVATDRKITMSDAARRELALEIIRQEATAAPKTASPAASEAIATELIKPIEASKPSQQVDVERVKAAIADDKQSQIRTSLAQDLEKQASANGVSLSPDVQSLILADLEKQTNGLSSSGLSVETIKLKNRTFVDAIAAQLTRGPVTPASYQVARQLVFQRFVNLRIETDPPGARVKMNNVELGATHIPSQPVEADKTYQFEFVLTGYNTARRHYFVAAGAPTDLLREPLTPIPASTTSIPGQTPEDPPGRGPRPDSQRFPWFYVTIGLAIIGALLFFARRS